jgi:uncharacterized protein
MATAPRFSRIRMATQMVVLMMSSMMTSWGMMSAISPALGGGGNDMDKAEQLVAALSLTPHPEGGFFREVYRAADSVQPSDSRPLRAAATHIYYLVRTADCSRLHRIVSDELWHFYGGDPLTVHMLTPSTHRYDHVVLSAEAPFAVVPGGVWFGARPAQARELPDCAPSDRIVHGYSLVGCTVAPGFSFDDFVFGDRDTLLAEFPHAQDIIIALT